MVYQPPAGAKDLFPLDVAQKQWIEERLHGVFHRWGYHRIITPTLERLDTLMAGGAVQQSTVIQLHDADNEVLGLRPELTASIARAAVTRMAEDSRPQRLYYTANVFRRTSKGSQNRQHEYFQAGVELLGSGGPMADAEALLLLVDCFQALQLDNWHLVVGDAGLTQSLLATFPAEWRDRVRVAIATLDRIAIESMPLSPALRDRALWMLDLRGQPADVIQRVASLDLEPQQRAMINNLKSLVEILQESLAHQGHSQQPTLVLDLSLVQVFDYYTGVVFDVIHASDHGQRILGQGGRYDQLLGLYHPQKKSYPGIGFSLNIEDLHQTLQPTGQLPTAPSPSDWLIVPITASSVADAFAHAHRLRTSSAEVVRVEVHLGAIESKDQIRLEAQRLGIRHVSWIEAGRPPEVESL